MILRKNYDDVFEISPSVIFVVGLLLFFGLMQRLLFASLSQAINSRGGRYLEAQVQGSKKQTEEGTLVILAAGDRSLFDDCQSCFQAMGKNSFYLGKFC